MLKDISSSPAAASPLAAFDGAIVPKRTGALYRAGLVLVAFAMGLLPILYLALIGLTGWAVYYHVTHDGWMLWGSGSQFRLIAYLLPAVAGVVLIFFMIKPFFAARQKAPENIALDAEKEPLLFAFVKEICDRVGAPMPSRIVVDCAVNASAGLRGGFLSRNLVLTIGLPLAAGLDMRQFAGVLAHEFGHFAQGAGMRLTYVIRRINAWFARVVFERDAWDVRLARYAAAAPWQAGLLLHGARACVWVTRRILWALMHVGHGISCFMLRQMEYDADSYEAKLVGGEVFETTFTRLRVLNVATHLAYQDVQQYWGNRRLPANLLLLIESKSTSLPDEIHRKITAIDPAEKTGWFDTHPCDADRIRAVRQLNEKGIFHLTEPAIRLFADFPGLSQAATRNQYEEHFELEFTDQDLIPADELLRESTEHSKADAVIERYYGAVNPGLHPLLIERQLPVPGEPAALLAEWRAACTEIDAQREQAEKISAACVERLERRHKLQSAYHLAMAEFEFPPADFGLPGHAASVSGLRAAAEAALPANETVIEGLLAQLEPFFAALRRRIGLALVVSPTIAEESAALVLALAAVGTEMKQTLAMAARLSALTILAENKNNHSDTLHVDHEAFKLASDIQKDVLRSWERLGSLAYPFAHPRGNLTIANYLQVGQSTESTWQSVHEGALVHVNRLIDLHHRLLGRVLTLADQAEKALGNM